VARKYLGPSRRERFTSWRASGFKSRRSVAVGLALAILIVGLDAAFAGIVSRFVLSAPNLLNPNPTYALNIPLRFSYYANQSLAYISNTSSPDFAFGLWIRGTTPVKDTILANQPLELSVRVDMPHAKTTPFPLNGTRAISIFFQDSLAPPIGSNDTDQLPATNVLVLVRGQNSSFLTSNYTEPIYFSVAGNYQPVVRFVGINRFNQSFILVTATAPELGSLVLNVASSSLAQDATISSENLVLTIAIFFFGLIESGDAISRVANWLIIRRQNQTCEPCHTSASQNQNPTYIE